VRDVGASTKDQRDSITKLLCDELEKGHSIRVACDKVGISEAAIYRWQRKAEAGDDEAIVLCRRLIAARARGFDQHVGKIKAAADDDWRAAAWLVDKLYPGWGGGKVQELVLRDREQIEQATEEERQRADAWSTPERLLVVVRSAVETGLVTIEELTGIAPQPRTTVKQLEPQSNPEPSVDHITQTVIVALAAGDRDLRELTDCVVNTMGCTQEQVFEAFNRLDVQLLQQRGAKTMVHLELPRTNENSGSPEAEPSRAGGPQVDGETSGSGWLNGGQGTGDFIARRRGR
jgi:hypothetical protein